MQELTFEQVEEVSGGFTGLTAPWERTIHADGGGSAGGSGGSNVSGGGGSSAGSGAGGTSFGCSMPSVGEVASVFGVGYGAGATVGAASGYSATAAAYGYIGIAVVGAAMAGYSVGVGINNALGVCD